MWFRRCGLERMQIKIEWTDIAFNLLPERFTLTELQMVYEVILGRELLTANFRRKIGAMVTVHTKKGKGGDECRAVPGKAVRRRLEVPAALVISAEPIPRREAPATPEACRTPQPDANATP